MLVACSWGLSPSWSSFEQISPTIESWNGIKKVYVTSRQEEAHIKRKREMRGFERKKNRYIYISTKALVAQWEFRWRINWQISSQLPARPVYREDLFGRPGEDWWDFVTVYHQDVASHFPRMGNKGCALRDFIGCDAPLVFEADVPGLQRQSFRFQIGNWRISSSFLFFFSWNRQSW